MPGQKSKHSAVIGQNIRKQRLLLNMKGETLASELGVTKAAISQLENGLVDVKISTLYKLSEIFNVPLNQLTGHTYEIGQAIDNASESASLDQAQMLKEILRNITQIIALIKVQQEVSKDT